MRTSKEKVREMREQLSRAIARRAVDGFLLGVERQITEGVEPHGYSPVTVTPYKNQTWAITSMGPTHTGVDGVGVARFCFVPISPGELVTTEVDTLIAKFLDQMGRTLDEEEVAMAQQILAVLEELKPDQSILAKKALYKFAAIFRKSGLLAMQNYLSWADANDVSIASRVTTVMHDLNGCQEPFFVPRSSDYLTEGSNGP